MNFDLLKSLNPAQLNAVKHPPDIPLQILAGPGSGKTKVLTSRIAYLILHYNFLPSSICAVTFTNKAASEMRERLTKLIGKEKTAEVRMGTFHALCASFLRIYCKDIGLKGNFTVCDADESKKIISNLLTPYKEVLKARDFHFPEGAIMSLISKAKSKGHSPDEIIAQNQRRTIPDNVSGTAHAIRKPDDIDSIVAAIYKDYEEHLTQNNSLDFDDLLLYGVKLFSQHQRTVRWCKHVLVDEFQDTNAMQYELMRHIAASNRCVTIVGDPDQSIYGWRSAEVENLHKMRKEFKGTEQILLEKNYRSTGSILTASMAIVSQDKARIQKTLQASHPTGPLPVLRSFLSEHDEATFIALEIKRLVATMGGMLRWGDFVVLLRFNALSRAVEGALQKEGIPNRVLGGHKFFERLEVKDLLAYLHIVDNPQFVPAFSRAINVPSRGIGEKTLAEILSRAEKIKVSPLEIVEQIHDSEAPDIKPPIKQKVKPFVQTVRELRRLVNNATLPADLIRRLVCLTSYEDHLRRTQPDWQSRWENVQELINFASDVQLDTNDATGSGTFERPEELGIQALEESSGMHETSVEEFAEAETKSSPLRLFLQALTLSSEGDNDTADRDKEKVTISTCHAAKGLEWPVVMIPAVEKGIFPFYRTEDVEEERRLLYVACTRAQGLLYLSHSTKRKVAGVTKAKELSEFIAAIVKENQTLFTNKSSEFFTADRVLIAGVLGRPEPQNAEVARRLAEFNRTTRSLLGKPEAVPMHNGSESNNQRQGLTGFTTSSTLPGVRNVLLQGGEANAKLPAHSKALAVAPAPIPQLAALVLESTPTSTNLLPNLSPHPNLGMSIAGNVTAPRKRLGMGRATVGYPNKKFKSPES